MQAARELKLRNRVTQRFDAGKRIPVRALPAEPNTAAEAHVDGHATSLAWVEPSFRFRGLAIHELIVSPPRAGTPCVSLYSRGFCEERARSF